MDFRYALRMLARSPGFTLIAVLTLALGIGINTIVFTLYGAVALKPIAAQAPQRLVRIRGNQDGRPFNAIPYTQFERIRKSQSFAGVIATSGPQTIVARTGDRPAGSAEVLRARFVSIDYFQVLGVRPVLGRAFVAGDNAAAVVSHEFWTHKLHSDPAVLGHSFISGGTALPIIGVAPPDFAGTGLPPQMPDFWAPLTAQTLIVPGVDWLHDDSAWEWQVVARLKPDASTQRASAEMEVLARSWPLVNGKPAHLSAVPATFFQADSGEFETFTLICKILMAAVAMILLIGCINLVNLLFARHSAREREFAVRLAIGAGRARLIRQLCAESVVLGILGGAAGLMLSLWACEAIRVAISGFLTRVSGGLLGIHLDIAPDWRVFAYTAAVSVITGIAIGLWPAVKASRGDLNRILKQTSGGPAGAHRKRSLLISAQVAACLMLLAGAGLLFRGVWQADAIDPGFEVRHLAVTGIDLKTVAPSAEGRTALLRKAADRIGALPEVVSIAWAERPPFLGHGSGDFKDEMNNRFPCLETRVSDRYFETLGVPVLQGRSFTAAEVETKAKVLVINDVAARAAWPGQNPIGRRVQAVDLDDRKYKPYTVIGVVKGIRSTYLSKPDEASLYFPMPLPSSFGSLLLRMRVAPESAAHSVMSAVGAIHPDLPSHSFFFALDEAPLQIQKMMAAAPAAVSGGLGALALLLASLGIFGLVSQLVAHRTREIAIRVSLGAKNGDVICAVMNQTLRPVILGAAVGLAGALAISVLLRSMVMVPDLPDLTYGAGAFDPLTFGAILAVLAAVIAAASFSPVRRAIRIAPAEALRNE